MSPRLSTEPKKLRADPSGLPLSSSKPKAAAAPPLLHRANALAQPRLVAGSSVPMQRALLDCLVERRDSLAIGLLGSRLVAFFDGLAQSAQSRAQPGAVGAIGGGAFRGLTGALKRRKMISHVWFVTFV